MRRCLPSQALPPSSIGRTEVRIPEHAVVYHFPKPFRPIVFTGFLASDDMQKRLRGLATGFVEETPLDEESPTDQPKKRRSGAEKKKNKKAERRQKQADRQAEQEAAKVRRTTKKAAKKSAKLQAKATDSDAEQISASGI
ncbi:MAG: hypothetical protein Q9193_004530 [Seirophora villosa]